MTAGVSDGSNEDALPTNEICNGEGEAWEIDAEKSTGSLPPNQRLPDNGRTCAFHLRSEADAQAWNTLLVVSGCLFDLGRCLRQELQL